MAAGMTLTRYTTTTVTSSTGDYDSSADAAATSARHGARRYSQGWKNNEEDRKPAARVAKVISQDYSVIKRECLAKKALWEDPTFPADDHSLYPSSHGRLPFKWMRPSVRLHAAKIVLRSRHAVQSTSQFQFQFFRS